jgi:HD-like signal output (HDOD) protein
MNEGQSFLNIIKGYLTSNKAVLPAFNATGMKIQREASKAEPDNNVIEKMITCDPALTSQVLAHRQFSFLQRVAKGFHRGECDRSFR